MTQHECEQVRKSSGNETAREVLRVAARLFADRGYDATPVREIVEAAGVTKPTLYYHFRSKEGLAQALVSTPMRGLIDELRGIAERPGDAVQRLADQIEAHFAFCREDPDRARFVFSLFFGPNAPGLSAEAALYGGQMAELVAEGVRGLVRDRIIPGHRAKHCAAAVQGLITFYVMDYLYQGANLGPGLGRRLVEDLLYGFASTRAGGPDPGAVLERRGGGS